MGAVVIACFCLMMTSAFADTYRWKDKEGKIHYGAAVPAEYADQPYDVLNNAGLVIRHVEDTSIPLEVRAEEEIQEKKPLLSDEERQRQSDRLLLVQYRSEDDIAKALESQLSQLGYEARIINQSYQSTNNAIRDQIRQAADQQRANQVIGADQQRGIDKLYRRLANDEKKRAYISKREDRIRARFRSDLDRYRSLTAKTEENQPGEANPG